MKYIRLIFTTNLRAHTWRQSRYIVAWALHMIKQLNYTNIATGFWKFSIISESNDMSRRKKERSHITYQKKQVNNNICFHTQCRWQSHQNGHATPFKRKSKRFQLIVSHFIYKNCQVNFWFSLPSQKLSKSDLIVSYRPDKRHKGSIGKCKSKRSVYEFSSRLTHLPCSLPSAISTASKLGFWAQEKDQWIDLNWQSCMLKWRTPVTRKRAWLNRIFSRQVINSLLQVTQPNLVLGTSQVRNFPLHSVFRCFHVNGFTAVLPPASFRGPENF